MQANFKQRQKILFSDQVLEPIVAPTDQLKPILEEQRTDIDRLLASFHRLQQDMISLRQLVEPSKSRRYQVSHGFVSGPTDSTTDSTTDVSSRRDELDALKLETKIMQQRIKYLEESISKGRQTSTMLGPAQLSKQSSPAFNESAISHNDASSNGLLFPANQTPTSTNLDGLFAPQTITFERHDMVEGDGPSFQDPPSESKAKTLPPSKQFTSSSRTPINGTVSTGSRTPISMPSSQTRHKVSERKVTMRRAPTRGTASTVVTGTTTSHTPENISQTQEAFTGSYQFQQDGSEYDDELVDDIRPQSSTGSSAERSRQPASNAPHSRQKQSSKLTQQPQPKSQQRKSARMAPLILEPSHENKSPRDRPAHHDRKRRKTTSSDANTPSRSIWAADPRELKAGSGRRGEPHLLVRIHREVDGGSARSRKLEGKGRK